MVIVLMGLLQLNLLMAAPAFSNENPFGPAEDYRQNSADDLLPRAEKFDVAAIRELGRRRERSAIKLLRKVASEPDIPEAWNAHPGQEPISSWERQVYAKADRRNLSHIEAKIALARMGVGNYFDEFIVGLSSSNPMWRADCIGYLGRVGDKRAVKYLIPILDERQSPGPYLTSFSSNASGALGCILPDVYSQFAKELAGKPFYPDKAWKDWWAKNKDSFDDSNDTK